VSHLHEEKECEYGEVVGESPGEEAVVGEAARGREEEGGAVGQVQPQQRRPDRQHAHTVHQPREEGATVLSTTAEQELRQLLADVRGIY
jgi:hypothetical protein